MTTESLLPKVTSWRTPLLVIVAGCIIAMIGFGIRSVFGLFLEPMTTAHGWSRETFAIAMAIQNLLWGIGVPIAGALADRYGPMRVLSVGAVIYGLGVWGMAVTDSSMGLHLFGGLLTGLGIAFTAFSLALAAMAKVVGPERRTLVLGLGTAAGSLGQVIFSPLGQQFIANYGWQSALMILAATALLIIPLSLCLPNNQTHTGEAACDQTLNEALREAMGHRGFVLLTVGFFVCGFHVAFITVHFPSYVKDLGLAPEVGAYALSIIGLFNIAGSFLSGAAGTRWSKKSGLAFIYFTRAIVITALLLAPKTPMTIYLFAAAMGILWLSTVPLTSGIVAQVFGVRYMATLFGIVFFSHQIGSFLGVWLGGRLYDTTGTYDAIWWAGVILGLVAAFIHLPINEHPLPRLAVESR
ncbi:MFS transporter [Sedimenticola selenatireducens]|uniref:MFS transporter n=1 Tax=Sedimenticola selenatireducens TaxID=191960 RepID=UPI001643272C|nr:MFS transporter [Sedimenticola selenatireducens]